LFNNCGEGTDGIYERASAFEDTSPDPYFFHGAVQQYFTRPCKRAVVPTGEIERAVARRSGSSESAEHTYERLICYEMTRRRRSGDLHRRFYEGKPARRRTWKSARERGDRPQDPRAETAANLTKLTARLIVHGIIHLPPRER